MKINLLVDYRGVLTGERFYTAGEYEIGAGVPLTEDQAKALIAAGRAVEVKPARRASRKRTTTTKRKTAKK
jgi:hypothetical protein